MQPDIGRWIVQPVEARVRLDQYLLPRIRNETRSQLQIWIRRGLVKVNEFAVKTGYRVRPGDVITFQRPIEHPALPRPEPIPLVILYQDADLAIIDKPAGMVCHLGAGVRSGTLVNALLYHFGAFESGDPVRPGIVHRLDKQTSGAMVVAKNQEAHRALSAQFKSRTVKKEYLALVYGTPERGSGTIDQPLGRDQKDRKKISARGRPLRGALTRFQVEKEYGPFSLLRVQIETGRTHQIRVHLSNRGHPVAGDPVYGAHGSRSLRDPKWRAALQDLERMFLHSYRLEFRHPRTGDALAFTVPLPLDLGVFLDELCILASGAS